jgi:hypothetical protein
MTYTQAVQIRERHRKRQPVDLREVEEANRIVAETRARERAAKSENPESAGCA